MGKKKNQQKTMRQPWHASLRPETKHSLWALFSFVVGIILTLSYFERAGLVGNTVAQGLLLLFGEAFFVVPIMCGVLGVSFLRAMERRVVASTLIGGFLFLISALGLFDMLTGASKAGYVGRAAAYPMLALFDVWAGSILMSALLLASILIMLNISLRIWRPKKKTADVVVNMPTISQAASGSEEATSASEANSVADDEDEDEDEEEPSTEQPTINGRKNMFGGHAIAFKTPVATRNSTPYTPPPLDMLEDTKGIPSSGDIKANANIIKRTLANFGIDVEMAEVNVGPSVTQYTLKPAEGIKLSRITALQNDLALALAAHPLRIEAPIPSRSLVGIEVPNRSIALVGLRSILGLEEYQKGNALLFALGRDVAGQSVFADLAKMPHLLVAGSTGSGKSISIHTFIISLLYKNAPQLLRFIMVDPKRVELSIYNKIPHLLTPVIIDAKKAVMALRWAVREMERRYEKLSEFSTRDINSYNAAAAKKGDDAEILPYLIIIIDELADLMGTYPREIESSIVRLAQMSRAVGIHLVVSTQRPSVEVITGLIKANITARIALVVASQIDSRTILDMSGAEKLLGNGDMLYLAGDTSKPRRIQGAFISEREVKSIVSYLVKHVDEVADGKEIVFESNTPLSAESFVDGDDDDPDDAVYEAARALVIESQKASTSFLQRRLRLGYARAARLMDLMEERGVIGPGDGAKPREVLIKPLPRVDSGSDIAARDDEVPYTDFDELS